MINYNPSNKTYVLLVDGSIEGYIETYLFRLDSTKKNPRGKGKLGEVVWTQTINGGTPKVSSFRAPCFFE